MVVFRRAKKKSIEGQKRAVISTIQRLKRELDMMNRDDYSKNINTDVKMPPSKDSYDPQYTEAGKETEL